MPPKRGRACDACHSIKIKCELGSTGGEPPCERCIRLGKDWAISPPVRQKDRVKELEAKLEVLTELLESPNIQTHPEDENEGSSRRHSSSRSVSTPEIAVSEKSSKKRRLELVFRNEETKNGVVGHSLTHESLEIDRLVPRYLQDQCFDKYRIEMEPFFPISSLAVTIEYDTLRQQYPILFQAIVYAASQGELSPEIQIELRSLCSVSLLQELSPKPRSTYNNTGNQGGKLLAKVAVMLT